MTDSTRVLDEKRDYFRVDDMAFLTYRVVSWAEARESQALDSSLPVHRHVIKANFDRLSRELQPLYNVIRLSNSKVAEYLTILDKKITLLSEYMFTEDTCENDVELQQVNIGGGGLLFISDKPIIENAMLELKMKLLPEEEICIFTYAKVISCTLYKEERDELTYRISVEYAFMDDDVRDLITRHVLHKERALINRVESSSDL